MAGAGALVALLLQIPNDDPIGQSVAIAGVGLVMIVYVLVGGMKGTTWVQIIKAVLLLIAAAVLTTWVLGYFGFNLSALLGRAVERNPAALPVGATDAVPLGERLLVPGLQYGADTVSKIDFLSLGLALVLGTAGLPHILMRFYTVPNSREARRSVVWAIWLIGVFYLFTLVLGYGAAALVPGGVQRIVDSPGGSNSAVPLLAYQLAAS
jgi:cation/acetate symporter